MRFLKQIPRSVSLVIAMLAGGILTTGAGFPPAYPDQFANAEIRVDLSERTLSAIENGEVVRTYSVAVGRPSNPTPTGTFRTGRIVWNPGWVPPNSDWAKDEIPREPGDPKNPMVGVKIYFREPAYYIHGTNAPASIGSAASRGCIRMHPDEAKSLARWIQEQGGSVRMVIQH
jgi:lipoprotein-anchoring transpeptidase ErfK/SrfK